MQMNVSLPYNTFGFITLVTSSTPPGWLAWAVAGVSAVGAYIYYNGDSLSNLMKMDYVSKMR